MGIIIGILMLTLGILLLHEIILSVFGLMFGLLIACLAILISFMGFAILVATMVIVGVLCLMGLVISILI